MALGEAAAARGKESVGRPLAVDHIKNHRRWLTRLVLSQSRDLARVCAFYGFGNERCS